MDQQTEKTEQTVKMIAPQKQKHILEVYRFDDCKNLYQPIYTENLLDDDARMLINYFASNIDIPGFYKYILTLESGDRYEHFTLCADLKQYAQYKIKKYLLLHPENKS